MSRGPKPRKNPGGLLRSIRQASGMTPGEAARAIGITRDVMSRREACPIGEIRISDAARHAQAVSPGATIRIDGYHAVAVDSAGIQIGRPESIDGAAARVQLRSGAESSQPDGAHGRSQRPRGTKEKG